MVSALGSGKSRRSTIASSAARAVIEACGRTGVDRLVWLSALGVGVSAADGSTLQRLLWRAVMAQVFSDKKIADEAIAASPLDYTLALYRFKTRRIGLTWGSMISVRRSGNTR